MLIPRPLSLPALAGITLLANVASAQDPAAPQASLDQIHPRTMFSLAIGIGDEDVETNTGDLVAGIFSSSTEATQIRLRGEHYFKSGIGLFVSGFVGRHLMNRLGHEVKEKRAMLKALRSAYAQAAHDFRSGPNRSSVHMGVIRAWLARVANQLVEQPVGVPPAAARVAPIDLADAIADVEYAIKTHETFKGWFAAWLKFHIAISLALYVLLALHVWAGIYFGLRWFS